MSRREARELAFKFLYQVEFRPQNVEEQKSLFLEIHAFDIAEEQYFRQVVDGVVQDRSEMDALISPLLKGWKIDRLPRVDLTILRIAVFEMRHLEEVPDSVAISEAVILAKRYGSEESKSYINAVLGKLAVGESQ
ncbi:MAG TPA: transcription antitermination factor NusB [Clostridiaceae bacterium]|jgi:N utilization substance protein B|nr:transcription antitermination factor NusB [Clostridiaceae bacterium]